MRKEMKTALVICQRFILLCVICMILPTGLTAQKSKTIYQKTPSDSIVMRTSIYFSPNGGDWIEKSEYKKAGKFVQWALSDTLSRIQLTGWTDKTGTEAYNEQLSLRRARSVHNYLVKKGVSTERIQFEGRTIDTQAENDAEARRVDMIGLAFIYAPIVVTKTVEPVLNEEKQIAMTEPEEEKEEAVVTAEPVVSNNPMQSENIPENNKQSFVSSRWYIGIGGGVSFGRSTFCSFAMDGTRPGFNVGALGGYKINKLLSAELSLDYTRMDLRTYDCCQLLWLAADGNRYAAPVAGIKNYAYNDLCSVSNLFGLGTHLNINLVSLWNEHYRWSALVSPAIYGVYSSAKLKQLSTGANVVDATSFHFGVGADLGVGYQFTDCFGLRLTTGFNYLTGKGIDGLLQEEHKANYVWNTSLKLIFKL